MALKILIVDDSPVMRRMLKRALGMARLPLGQVLEADEGTQALRVLARVWVDLVLSDIHMLPMNGIELVERMAADRNLSSIPVIVVSTERGEPRIERLRQFGVRGFLNKPFQPEALGRLAASALGIEERP